MQSPTKSLVLSKFLEKNVLNHKISSLEDKTVIELGAGCAISSISLSFLGVRNQNLFISDHPQALTATTIPSCRLNGIPKESCISLDWLESPLEWKGIFKQNGELITFDIIIASDVIWIDPLIEPFVKVLDYLCCGDSQRVSPVVVYLSLQHRYDRGDQLFFKMLDKYGFEKQVIPKSDCDYEFVSDRIDIYEIRKERRKGVELN